MRSKAGVPASPGTRKEEALVAAFRGGAFGEERGQDLLLAEVSPAGQIEKAAFADDEIVGREFLDKRVLDQVKALHRCAILFGPGARPAKDPPMPRRNLQCRGRQSRGRRRRACQPTPTSGRSSDASARPARSRPERAPGRCAPRSWW